MVITLADACTDKTQPVLEAAYSRSFKDRRVTQITVKQTYVESSRCSIYFHLCVWSLSLQLHSGPACWLTTQASPSKTSSLSPCCSMSNGIFFHSVFLVFRSQTKSFSLPSLPPTWLKAHFLPWSHKYVKIEVNFLWPQKSQRNHKGSTASQKKAGEILHHFCKGVMGSLAFSAMFMSLTRKL